MGAVTESANAEVVASSDVLEDLLSGGDAGVLVGEHDSGAGIGMEGDPILPAGIRIAVHGERRESAGTGCEQVVTVVLLTQDVVASDRGVSTLHVGAVDGLAQILSHSSDHRANSGIGAAAGAVTNVDSGSAVGPNLLRAAGSGSFGLGFFLSGSLFLLRATASDQADGHGQCQDQGQKLLHYSFSFFL